MNKWLSRTFWLIVGVILISTLLLIGGHITDTIWQAVVVLLVGGWIGNDITNKIKGKNE